MKFNYPLLKTAIFAILFTMNLTAQNWKSEISSNYFYIRVANSNKYLDLPGKHPDTANKDIQFQIWDKTDDTYERSFTFPSINKTEFFAIRNKAGYILDVEGKNDLNVKEKLQKKMGKKFNMKKDDGAKILTWSFDASKGVAKWQQWRLIVVDKNKVMFENVFTEKAMTVDGNFTNNGTMIVSNKRVNNNNQIFVLEYADGPKRGDLLSFE